MANAYIYYVVTVDGAALIAKATAANPIVYVAALSKATAAESDADLSTKPASWYDGKTGDIAAVSAVGNNARIVAVWGNQGSAQPAKSLAVTARLASQTDEEAVVMTAMSDPDSTVTLPGADDIQGGVEVPFNVALNASGDVEVTPGAAASIADLARFVSLHKAGDPTQGEAQTILGEKTFYDDARFDGSVTVRGGVLKTDVLQAYSPGAIELGNSIVPDTDAALDLGSHDYNFRTVYTNALYSYAMDADEGGKLTLAGVDPSSGSTSTATIDLIAKQSDSDEYPSFGVYLYNSYAGESCELTFKDGVLAGIGSNGICLGTQSWPWDGYIYDLYVHRLYKFDSSATSITTDSLVPSGNAVYLGLQQLPFANVNATAFHGLDFLPLDNTADVGKSDNKFRNVYANNLSGVIPHPTASNADPPVGSIVMLEVSDGASYDINFGDQLQGIASRSLKLAVWDAGAGEWGNRGNALGSSLVFRALSGGSPSSTHRNYVLAIRVQ